MSKEPKHVMCGLCAGKVLLSHNDYVLVVYHVGHFICNRCRERDGHEKHPLEELSYTEHDFNGSG